MSNVSKPRNWLLVFLAVIVLIFNLVLILIAAAYIETLGWLSLLFIVGAAVSIFMSSMAIIKKDPVWLLLDLILPN
jgi:hypothetical protein